MNDMVKMFNVNGN